MFTKPFYQNSYLTDPFTLGHTVVMVKMLRFGLAEIRCTDLVLLNGCKMLINWNIIWLNMNNVGPIGPAEGMFIWWRCETFCQGALAAVPGRPQGLRPPRAVLHNTLPSVAVPLYDQSPVQAQPKHNSYFYMHTIISSADLPHLSYFFVWQKQIIIPLLQNNFKLFTTKYGAQNITCLIISWRQQDLSQRVKHRPWPPEHDY